MVPYKHKYHYHRSRKKKHLCFQKQKWWSVDWTAWCEKLPTNYQKRQVLKQQGKKKEYVQAWEINSGTDYKRWLPKGWPNCSSKENTMFLLENLKENPLRGRQSPNVATGENNTKHCIWVNSTKPNEEHQLPHIHQATGEVWCFEASLHIFSWRKVYKESVSL